MISLACLRLRFSRCGEGGSESIDGMRSERSRASSATMRVSRTLSDENKRAFWNARPMPSLARRGAERFWASVPKISMLPVLGTNPLIAFISVDLPAPFVPIRPMISPGPTVMEALSTTTRPVKLTETSRTRSGTALFSSWVFTDASELTLPVWVLRFGSHPLRFANQPNRRSRPEWITETRPPGKYRRTTSMPMLLANSFT